MAGSRLPLPATTQVRLRRAVGEAESGRQTSEERVVDCAEHEIDVAAQRGHGGDTDNSDQADKQAVLDQGCAVFLLNETCKVLTHGGILVWGFRSRPAWQCPACHEIMYLSFFRTAPEFGPTYPRYTRLNVSAPH